MERVSAEQSSRLETELGSRMKVELENWRLEADRTEQRLQRELEAEISQVSQLLHANMQTVNGEKQRKKSYKKILIDFCPGINIWFQY